MVASLHDRTPEQKAASKAKAAATRKRKKDAKAAEDQQAQDRALNLKYGIDALEKRHADSSRHVLANNASFMLTGKTLLTHSEIAEGAITFKRSSGVYFLVHEKEVVYVGQSSDIFTRVSTHSKEKIFGRFAFVPCEPELLDKLESLYIHTLRPKLNGVMTNGMKQAPLSLDKILSASHGVNT